MLVLLLAHITLWFTNTTTCLTQIKSKTLRNHSLPAAKADDVAVVSTGASSAAVFAAFASAATAALVVAAAAAADDDAAVAAATYHSIYTSCDVLVREVDMQKLIHIMQTSTPGG